MKRGVPAALAAEASRRIHTLLADDPANELATRSPFLLILFALAMSAFSAGLLYLSRHNAFAVTGLSLTLYILAAVAVSYGALSYFFPRKSVVKELPISEVRLTLWWVLFAIMVAGAIAVLIYAPTLTFSELMRHVRDPGYKSNYSDIEIRLSSSFMPIWAQALFEFGRRFAAPYCILEFCFTPLIKDNRKVIGLALAAVLLFFVFSTLDRAIPVLYLAMCSFGLFLAHGWRALRNKYLYLNILGIFAAIVLLKNIQYGEIRDIQFAQNEEISRSLSEPVSAPVEAAGKPPAAAEPAPVAHEPVKEPAAAPTKPAAPAPKPEAVVQPDVQSGAKVSDYMGYIGSSVIDRIVLSPVAMVLYAIEHYDSTNFTHWSTTRLFSLLGFGRYVTPFEVGAKPHHDAFPVTFIGDVWRNGGMGYALHYGIFLAIVLFALDRTVFSVATRSALPLKVISVFGLIYLFYGNAFNATSWVMLAGAAAVYWLLSRQPASD